MNLAKVSGNGQITVPLEIRRELKVKSGDKIIFFRKDNGEIVVQNLNGTAMAEVRKAVAEAKV